MWQIKSRKTSATFKYLKQLTEGTFEVGIHPDHEKWQFTSGQYIWLILPDLKYPDSKGNRRAFFLTNRSGDEIVTIVFGMSSSGFKRTLVEMKPGDKIWIEGPFGSLAIPDGQNTPVVMLASNLGINAFMSILRSCNWEQRLGGWDLYYFSGQDNNQTVFVQELNDLAARVNNFRFHAVDGQVNIELLTNEIQDKIEKKWLVAGSGSMVEEVKQWLKENQVAEENVFIEQFYPRKLPESEPEQMSQKELEIAIQSAVEHVVITDVDGYIWYCNPAAEKITGFNAEEMKGETPRLWGGLMSREYYQNMWNTIKKQRQQFTGQIVNRRKNGELYIARLKIAPFVDSDNQLKGFVANEEDITKEMEADKLKQEFISLASHQLRTPLTSIRWNLELLEAKTAQVSGEWKKYSHSAFQAVLRMADLVNGLLNITRIESGRLAIKPEKIELNNIIDGVVSDLKPLAEKKGLIIQTEFDNEAVKIEADPKLLENVYLCLISNAIKYSAEGKTIIIRVSRGDDTHVTSSVKDEGIGIPEQEKAKVFEKFFRAENAVAMISEGTGLGLYMAKQIVEACGGRIWFESRESEGSQFNFSIPVSADGIRKGEVGLERQAGY